MKERNFVRGMERGFKNKTFKQNNMDTIHLKKNCPRCNTEIEPKRYATTGDKALSGVFGAAGAAVGFALGEPIGAVIGVAVSYFGNKKATMTIEDDHDQSQWF